MAKKAIKQKPDYTCNDCKHAYDFHDKNWKGEYFMCKCPYFKWSRFLNISYCDKFEKK